MVDLTNLDGLRFDRDGGVATLTLNRPERLNSFTIDMWDQMREMGEQLVADDSIRVLVVRGEGRAFSSGIDTAEFGRAFMNLGDGTGDGSGSGDPHADLLALIDRMQRAFTWLADAPFVTVASINGYAYGAGLQCALACDLRIASRSAWLGLLEFNWGILPDLGGTQRLPRLVGPGKAKELIFTAAKIDGEEAHRIGLVERLVNDDALEAETAALVATLAAQPPLAVRGTKRAINEGMSLPIADGLRAEAEGQAPCLVSDDMKEAITAALEGRAPNYQGR
ncbi:MAG: enoyl-CoA hydratase/isomerase family protein [Acidimicrobiia bacterium]